MLQQASSSVPGSGKAHIFNPTTLQRGGTGGTALVRNGRTGALTVGTAVTSSCLRTPPSCFLVAAYALLSLFSTMALKGTDTDSGVLVGTGTGAR
jgi:hypothetical protein